MSVEFSPHAEVDVENAVDELTDDYGPALAITFRLRLTATVNQLASMPLAFSLVDQPQWEVFTRFQHRSGAYGLIADLDASNAVTAGFRYKF